MGRAAEIENKHEYAKLLVETLPHVIHTANISGWILSPGSPQTNGFLFTSGASAQATTLSVIVAYYTKCFYNCPIDPSHQIVFTLVNDQGGQPGTTIYGSAVVVAPAQDYSIVRVPFAAHLTAGTTYWLLATANAEGTLWGLAGSCTGVVGTCPSTYTGTRAVRGGGALFGGSWNLNQTNVPKGGFSIE